MDYTIEVYDTWGRRIAAYDEVPLLELTRSCPGERDRVAGLLPKDLTDLSHAYRVRAVLDGKVFCDVPIEVVNPAWGDERKLILDKYVSFHEVMEIDARGPLRPGNTFVSRAYTNREISAIVRDVINSALGSLHYTVTHTAYPDGAQREYSKFLARRQPGNELEVGGISEGQWVGSDRMDLSGAYAKDGDTIAGIEVDGDAWPDLRMMLIDAEETSRNTHAIKWHPEVAEWTDSQYAASGYKHKADAAKALLQDLLDTKGIDYIELNPHRNAAGEYDDRVDAYGRYLGLVYGGGECFNAALVEQGLAEVYLYEDGKYHVPEMALKDFFSYAGVHGNSVEATGVSLSSFDVRGGALEVLTALAYGSGGFVFSVSPDLTVRFRRADTPDRVVFFDPAATGVQLGSDSSGLVNYLYFEGSPLGAMGEQTYSRSESIDEYGLRSGRLEYFSISHAKDAEKIAEGLLQDVAYPEPSGTVTFFRGMPDLEAGEIVEFRDGPLRRLERELGEEWGARFSGKLVGRVRKVRHRISGRQVTTTAFLSSPLRSVLGPMGFIVRGQDSPAEFFEFRLDDPLVGLDLGFHLD